MNGTELRADSTGSIELVCERTEADADPPRLRPFSGGDEFGLLVDDLRPGERVTLFTDEYEPLEE